MDTININFMFLSSISFVSLTQRNKGYAGEEHKTKLMEPRNLAGFQKSLCTDLWWDCTAISKVGLTSEQEGIRLF